MHIAGCVLSVLLSVLFIAAIIRKIVRDSAPKVPQCTCGYSWPDHGHDPTCAYYKPEYAQVVAHEAAVGDAWVAQAMKSGEQYLLDFTG